MIHRWTMKDNKMVPVSIKSKHPKTKKAIAEYISLLKGKKYLTYFREEDIIINVIHSRETCGFEYLVQDTSGEQRTHRTYIYIEEVY